MQLLSKYVFAIVCVQASIVSSLLLLECFSQPLPTMSASTSTSVMSSPKRFTSTRKPLGATSSNGSMNSDSAATIEGDDEVADADAVVHGLPCLADNNFSNSYTWHSAGRYKGKEAAIDASSTGNAVSQHSWKDSNSELITGSAEEEEQSQEQWILGVDEAGRGPALGTGLSTRCKHTRKVLA